jgi:hypothetical protein
MAVLLQNFSPGFSPKVAGASFSGTGGVVIFGFFSTAAWSIYATATLKTPSCSSSCFRTAVVALAALVALDWDFLDSKYLGTLAALARPLIHFTIA